MSSSVSHCNSSFQPSCLFHTDLISSEITGTIGRNFDSSSVQVTCNVFTAGGGEGRIVSDVVEDNILVRLSIAFQLPFLVRGALPSAAYAV